MLGRWVRQIDVMVRQIREMWARTVWCIGMTVQACSLRLGRQTRQTVRQIGTDR